MAVELLIVGTSGLAKEAAQLARQIDRTCARWDRISYVAENNSAVGDTLPFGQVRYTDAELPTFDRAADLAIAIGYPEPRQRIAKKLSICRQFTFPNLVHPGVEVDPNYVQLGQGCMLCAGVVVTCDISIGDFTLLNWNVTIGHDTRVDSCCVINPGANISGNVHIGDGCFLGTGCQVLEGLSIAAGAIIGAGAVVLASIPSAGTWVGVPARKVK